MLSRLSTPPLSVLRRTTLIFVSIITFVHVRAQQSPPQSKSGSSFSAKLINIEAATNETFRYSTTLRNGSDAAHVYDLQTNLPAGWVITFKVESSQVTSINIDRGKSQDISVEVNASPEARPGKYKIPIHAITGKDTIALTLEAVVKGTYSLSLTTPTGRLSEEVTSGSQKQLQLVVKNSGTLSLNNINLSSQLPAGWEATFEPSNINEIKPSNSRNVILTLKVPDKTLVGDYAATFTASNSSTNSQVSFRLAVKTSLLAGWIGMVVILLAVGIVYYLIRKYGRR
ncbi:COG1470 family protein [Mucilaginibacter kameinonensis]|uniref:COG1470 family protein n=1 Tax=Mucilaginibacter kameinonensis TaxID=452286 RepID=UPI000EF83F6D|nr:NEW3 domain-containing protein [Mucilaginibacter kameinonensis]